MNFFVQMLVLTKNRDNNEKIIVEHLDKLPKIRRSGSVKIRQPLTIGHESGNLFKAFKKMYSGIT